MSETMPINIDQIFLVVLPYVAIVIFLVMTIHRYRSKKYSYRKVRYMFYRKR